MLPPSEIYLLLHVRYKLPLDVHRFWSIPSVSVPFDIEIKNHLSYDNLDQSYCEESARTHMISITEAASSVS